VWVARQLRPDEALVSIVLVNIVISPGELSLEVDFGAGQLSLEVAFAG
jgi:hypothetical protein